MLEFNLKVSSLHLFLSFLFLPLVCVTRFVNEDLDLLVCLDTIISLKERSRWWLLSPLNFALMISRSKQKDTKRNEGTQERQRVFCFSLEGKQEARTRNRMHASLRDLIYCF